MLYLQVRAKCKLNIYSIYHHAHHIQNGWDKNHFTQVKVMWHLLLGTKRRTRKEWYPLSTFLQQTLPSAFLYIYTISSDATLVT